MGQKHFLTKKSNLILYTFFTFYYESKGFKSSYLNFSVYSFSSASKYLKYP